MNSGPKVSLQLDRLLDALQSEDPDLDSIKNGITQARDQAVESTATETKVGAAAILFESLARGDTLPTAAVESIRGALAAKSVREARAVAIQLSSDLETREIGLVCAGIVAVKARLLELAGTYFDLVPRSTVLQYAAPEWFRVAFHRDSDAALESFQNNPSTNPETVVTLVQLCLANKRLTDALTLLRHLSVLNNPLPGSLDADVSFIERYFERRHRTALASAEATISTPIIGIWDFSTPDRNLPPHDIGEHVESLTWLACLSQAASIDYSSDPEISTVLRKLRHLGRAETPPSGSRQVSLTIIPRFAPESTDVPPGTWSIHHGDFGSRVFGTDQPLPIVPGVYPIFLGWSHKNATMLSQDELQVLRRYGPVGCRDQTSLWMLTALGVEAFLSGSLASTMESSKGLETHHVDKPSGSFVPFEDVQSGVAVFPLANKAFRDEALVKNLEAALSYVCPTSGRTSGAKIAANAGSICDRPAEKDTTQSRLTLDSHGLCDPAPETLSLLTNILDLITDGTAPDAVYAAWRKMAAPLVTAARASFSVLGDTPSPGFNVSAAISRLQRAKVCRGQASGTGRIVHVAMASDDLLFAQLAVALDSLRSTTTRPLSVHLLTRSVSLDDCEWLASLFPDVAFEFYPCDTVSYGDRHTQSSHITVSTLDRLLLPSLLTGINQIIYLDADLVALSDIGVLADIHLTSHPVAACTSTADWARNGANHILKVAKRLDNDRSNELIRALCQQGHLTFEAFNAGVMVLNLEQMRDDHFCERFLGYSSRYGLNDQEVLYLYSGGRTRRLHHSWNAIPSHSYVSGPRIVHWAGPIKPWGSLRVPYQKTWLDLRSRLRSRAASDGIDVTILDAI